MFDSKRPTAGKPGVRSSVIGFDANWPGGSAGSGSVPSPVEDNIYPGYIEEIPGNSGSLAKSGYTWLGWAWDSSASSPDFEGGERWVSVDGDTLYAVWQANSTYTVSYNGNGNTGGSVPTDSNVYLQGASVTVAANSGGLVKSGYSFLGWSTVSGASSPTFVVNGSNVNPSSFNMPASNVILYAVWQQIQPFTVTYNGNGNTGGAVPVDGNSPYSSGSTVTVLGNTGNLVKTNYTFLGWSTNSGASSAQYTQGSTFTIAQNTTLYAVWQAVPPPKYWVLYNGNGNTGGSEPLDYSSPYSSGSTVTVLGQGSLTKANCIFLGWSTNSGASSAQYTQGSTFTIAQNIILYAVWQINQGPTYTVTYNGNGHTSGTVPTDSNTYAFNASVTVAANSGNLVKSGYSFLGWSTVSGASSPTFVVNGSNVNPSSFNMPASNVILYAVWQAQSNVIDSETQASTWSTALWNITPSSAYWTGFGQQFQGNGGAVSEVQLYGRKNVASGGGTLVCKIYSSLAAVQAGTPLATSNEINYNDLPVSDGWFSFTFPTPFQTVSGQKYFIVITAGTTLGTSYVHMYYSGAQRFNFEVLGREYGSWRVVHNGASGNSFMFKVLNSAPTFKVTYVGNGALSGSVPVDNTAYMQGASVSVAANTGGLVRTGYTFLGWSQNSAAVTPTFSVSGNGIVTPASFVMGSANVTLYAIWELNTGGGGDPLELVDQINPNTSSGFLPIVGDDVVGQGFTGNGSLISEAKFKLSLMDSVIEGSVHAAIYAHNDGVWGSDGLPVGEPLAVSNSIRYDDIVGRNGVADWVSFLFTGGNKFQTAVGEHYFICLVGEGISNYGSGGHVGVCVTDNSSAFNGGTAIIGENVGSYNVWSVYSEGRVLFEVYGAFFNSSCSVTYVASDAVDGVVPVDSNSYGQGALVSVAGNPGGLTREGFVFGGWVSSATPYSPFRFNGSVVVPAVFPMSISNVTLYAIWIPLFSVTYDGVGNTDGSAPIDLNSPYPEGSSVAVLGRGSLVKTNYTFYGWYSPLTDTIYLEYDLFTITEDTVLYAIWIQGGPPMAYQFYVVYVGNGNTSGEAPVDPNVPYHDNDLVTILDQGDLSRAGYNFLGWTRDPRLSTVDCVPGQKFNIRAHFVILYAVWEPILGTIPVPFDGRCIGSESKKTKLSYYTGAPVILSVESNAPDGVMPDKLDFSAVIENLVIDGSLNGNGVIVANTVGILLDDVSNCLIRNVTIMNCEVGIRVKLTGDKGGFSCGNRFEHIRMVNVKTGILFEGVSGAKDFSCTTIDDVGISLEDQIASSDVGIKIGVNANLFSSFIKANVWLAKSMGTGLEVNGQIKGSLVNFAVEQNTGYNGCGMRINSGAVVKDNQSFHLTALKLPSDKLVDNNNPNDNDVIVDS